MVIPVGPKRSSQDCSSSPSAAPGTTRGPLGCSSLAGSTCALGSAFSLGGAAGLVLMVLRVGKVPSAWGFGVGVDGATDGLAAGAAFAGAAFASGAGAAFGAGLGVASRRGCGLGATEAPEAKGLIASTTSPTL